MRKLASIQTISKLEAIEDADKIEKATVLGWEVVVKKGDFKEGDSCVYCEIDSILPDKPEFEFLKDRKFRIKTIKLRGQVSQGICFPMSILPPKEYYIGMDVTDIIGVTKYDPITIYEEKERDRLRAVYKNRIDKFLKRYKWYRNIIFRPNKHPFPKFIKKTDEDRIQLFPNICEEQENTVFVATEKLDGTSFTAFLIRNPAKWKFWKKDLYGACSRNYHLLKNDKSVYWKISKQLNIEDKLRRIKKCFNDDKIVLQGEIIGESVQGNKYKLQGLKLFVFNLYLGDNLCNDYELREVCNLVGLNTVPLVSSNFKLGDTINESIKSSSGFSVVNKDVLREGLVVRNYDKKISFKIINVDYLLKFDE